MHVVPEINCGRWSNIRGESLSCQLYFLKRSPNKKDSSATNVNTVQNSTRDIEQALLSS